MRFNITVSSISPLLSYFPRLLWSEADPNDPLLPTYQFGSYHATNVSNASVSFSWVGTGIWVYGGYRQRSGPYVVTLDQTEAGFPGFKSGAVEKADALLFGAGALAAGTHRIELQNLISNDGTGVLDLSYLVFETYDNILNQNATTLNDTAGSAGPQFQFITPPGNPEWVQGPSNASITNSSTAQADFTFTTPLLPAPNFLTPAGTAVALYGSLRGPSAACEITLESGKASQAGRPANTEGDTGTQLLYFANNLPLKNHTLTITNNPTSPGINNTLVITKAITYSSNSSVPTSSSSPHAQNTPGIHYTVPLAVGATSGAALIVAAWVLGRWYVRRRSQARKRREIRTPRPFPVGGPWPRGFARVGVQAPPDAVLGHMRRVRPDLSHHLVYA